VLCGIGPSRTTSDWRDFRSGPNVLGHKGRSITSRYIHGSDAVLLAAADTVANRTLALMGMAPGSEVIEFRLAISA
jgi:hypothetical protein